MADASDQLQEAIELLARALSILQEITLHQDPTSRRSVDELARLANWTSNKPPDH